jgi:hypothetical protein
MTTLELERELQAEQTLAERLEQYAGEWVAVRNHEVVAHAGSLQELREQIGQEEVEGAFKVPEGAEAACFF